VEGIELVVVLHPIPPSETSHPSFFITFFITFLKKQKVFVYSSTLLFLSGEDRLDVLKLLWYYNGTFLNDFH
jgi:hypothetical protein